jgi:hypothetical protein
VVIIRAVAVGGGCLCFDGCDGLGGRFRDSDIDRDRFCDRHREQH